MQEAAYAAILGASLGSDKQSGETPFDKAILVGKKELGTDFHSLTAKQSGVARPLQKSLNYGENAPY